MIYPLLSMFILTFVVMMLTLHSRLSAYFSGQVKAKYFRLMDGPPPTEYIRKTSRLLMNMFEVPVLFYTIMVLCLAKNISSELLINTAWGYVIARTIQAIIHLTYNNPLHRLLAFIVSNICLVVIWAIVATEFI